MLGCPHWDELLTTGPKLMGVPKMKSAFALGLPHMKTPVAIPTITNLILLPFDHFISRSFQRSANISRFHYLICCLGGFIESSHSINPGKFVNLRAGTVFLTFFRTTLESQFQRKDTFSVISPANVVQ
jgi:hypothetical protein